MTRRPTLTVVPDDVAADGAPTAGSPYAAAVDLIRAAAAHPEPEQGLGPAGDLFLVLATTAGPEYAAEVVEAVAGIAAVLVGRVRRLEEAGEHG